MRTKEETEVKTTYQDVTSDDLKKLSPGSYYCEAVITFTNPEDENERLTSMFTIYDGIAFSKINIDGVDREIVATFPLVRFINTTAKTTMKKKIMEAYDIQEDRDLTPIEILIAYSQIRFIDQYTTF